MDQTFILSERAAKVFSNFGIQNDYGFKLKNVRILLVDPNRQKSKSSQLKKKIELEINQQQKRVQIIETPAMGEESCYQDLKKMLQQFKFHAIVITSKLDSRYEDNTLYELKQIGKIFKEQATIIFLISNLDIIEDSRLYQFMSKLNSSLQKYERINPTILYGERSDFRKIEQLIYFQALREQLKFYDINERKAKQMFKQKIKKNQIAQTGQKKNSRIYKFNWPKIIFLCLSGIIKAWKLLLRILIFFKHKSFKKPSI